MSEKVDMRALLEVAKCPCCDGSGGRYDNYGNAEQCQWCYERSVAIAAPAPVATTVCSACRGSGKELHVYGPATLCRDCRPDAALVEALEHARQFIRNGIDLGFIRMPDADTDDPAHKTLPKIDAALSTYRAALAGKGGE